MSYDWNETHEVGTPAPEMPDGEHDVTLARVFYDKRDGTPLQSKSGLPQMGFVFNNAAGEEATYYCSINNGDIHWPERSIVPVLRALSGITISALQKAGVTPEHFLNRDWAGKMLVEKPRTARIKVSRRQAKPNADGTPGKVFVDVTPLIPATPAPPVTKPAPTPRSNKVEEPVDDTAEEPLPF